MAKAQLGFDITANNNPALKAIKEVKKEGVDAAEEIQAKNREAIKAALGMFAPIAVAITSLMSIAGKVSEAVGRIFERGRQFQEFADKAKLSAESMAQLKAEADSAGVSAERFNQALGDLASGKTTIQRLREEWGALNGEIDASSRMLNNFKDLARTRNVEQLGESWKGATDWVASQLVKLSGADNKHIALAMTNAANGVSWERTQQELIVNNDAVNPLVRLLNNGLFDNRNWLQEAQDAYRTTQQRMLADKLASEQRALEYYTLDVMKQGYTDDVLLERAFRSAMPGRNDTAKEIRARYDFIRRRDNPYEYEKEAIKEEQKRIDEEKRKLAEEEKKRLDADLKAKEEELKRLEEQRKKDEEFRLKIAKLVYDSSDREKNRKELEEFYKDWVGEALTLKEIEDLAFNSLTKEEKAMQDWKAQQELKDSLKRIDDEAKSRTDGIAKTELSRTLGEVGGLLANVNYGLRLEDEEREKMRLFRAMSNSTKKSVDELVKINKVLSED